MAAGGSCRGQRRERCVCLLRWETLKHVCMLMGLIQSRGEPDVQEEGGTLQK